ncbi:hypothetical protein NPIL_455351 [Nephila pilipes]|uniref:Uncharacterized protein n=1 Tax=Nephila pilipes TaxID=299642 RepID=A0A8X6UM95_NEPPI|nr:hypothetical protein NPIL_455351 [Nephila pilipes]
MMYEIKKTLHVCRFKKWTERNSTSSSIADPPSQRKRMSCILHETAIIFEGILLFAAIFIFSRLLIFYCNGKLRTARP